MDTEMIAMFQTVIDKIDGLDRKMDSLETRFDGLEIRFDGLETRFDGLETKFDGLEARFDGLEKRVDGLDMKIDQEIRSIKIIIENDITKRIDSLFDGYQQNLEQQYMLKEEVESLGKRVDRLEVMAG